MYHQIRWTVEKIRQRLELLESYVYRKKVDLPAFRLHIAPDSEPETPFIGCDVDDSDWDVVEANSYWGFWLANFTLRTMFQASAEWVGDNPVALYLPLGDAGDFSHPEALAFIDEEPYAACDRHHQEIILPERFLDGDSHLLALYGWTGLGGMHDQKLNTKLLMRPCQIVQIDQATRDFIAAARVALGTVNTLEENHPSRSHLLNALDDAFKLLDIREACSDAFYASVPKAHEALKAGVAKAGPAMDVTVVGTGHAHIDVAWLWSLAQTRRKCGRTFHTVLRLMEQFPDYHFTQSQPQLYEFVQKDYPELFDAIKERIAEGRWETIGGMWVEADCNLSGPESLARQFLLGRRYFREHFGPDAESPVLWLPDVFGYAWNLPQLIKQSGMEYFFTIKIGWNQYNRLPYDSFWWQGLDGTKVLTHFSTTPDHGSHGLSTYNALATPEQNLGTWNLFQQKESQRDLLMAFGYGDGGGGPTREMLENVREMKNFSAMPQMRQIHVGDFFRQIEETSGDKLPTWNGELYFELHRGTYTTQSANKRANRKSEFLLHDAEFLASLAMVLDPDYAYPADVLTDAWKLVCINQFHDIIPGSSIHQVYVDSQAQYEEIRQMGEQVKQDALATIGQQMNADVVVVNPTSFEQRGIAYLPEQLPENQQLIGSDGTPVVTQITDDGTLINVESLPPLSLTSLRKSDGNLKGGKDLEGLSVSVGVRPAFLENAYLRVELGEAGDITRIFDKANNREVLPEGTQANQFMAFEDRPKQWDAWDIDIFYDDKCWFSDPASSIAVVEEGPLRATIEIKRRVLHSEYTQRISLTQNSPQLRFDTTIDWREDNILLKTAFPIDVLSPAATYEIQWGNVERPTHHNTSWDWARFEVCAQKWADLSEGDYGVSLLNDCKYGHDIKDNVIRLSLLRAPSAPDPEADRGVHRFAYSLLPHAGRWGQETIAAAYALNDPIFAVSLNKGAESSLGSASLSDGKPFISVDRSNVVIETIKRAEDGNGVIVRFYETQRQRGTVTLTAGFPIAKAEIVNIIEDFQEALTPDGHQVSVFVKPFQIVTLRLLPQKNA